jgi:alkyl hydroperoxide reductase subunit AhpC
MDSRFSNKRYAEDIGVKFPLLSDWKRDVTKDYGLYNEESGYGTRATFLVDKEGKIQYVEVGNTAINPIGAYEACNLLEKKKEVQKRKDLEQKIEKKP